MQKPKNIGKIHEEVLSYLLKLRKFSDLKFDLRTSNRKSRLDKGFWFFGDENFLTISFWKGKDRGTRRPKISFVIVHNGKYFLDFSQRDVTSGTDYFNRDFMKSIGARPSDSGDSYKKNYPEFGVSYMSALRSFIDNDRKTIDDAIINNNIIPPFENEQLDRIGFLDQEHFHQSLKNILLFRQNLLNRIKSTGYIRSIDIEDFRPINKVSIKIPEDCRWVFITGENGSGKTTLLRAIAVGLCNNNDNGHKMYQDHWNFKIRTVLDGPNGHEKYIINAKEPIDGKKIIAHGFAAYGPIRLFTKGSLDNELFNVDKAKIHQRSTYGLFHVIDVLRDLSEPLKLVERPKFYQISVDNFMDNLREILGIFHVSMLDDEDGIRLHYFLSSPEEAKSNVVKGLTFSELPSGIRNYSAIICDLLIRFREMQPEIYDPASFTGIVLIDEIDLHLHPKIQKQIIEQLSATFPKIQFIVSTHSPIPLLGAPKNSIFLNVNHDINKGVMVEKLEIKVDNLLPNAILSSPIFDFNQMASVAHEPNERFITEDDYSEALFYRILEKKIRENSLRRQES